MPGAGIAARSDRVCGRQRNPDRRSALLGPGCRASRRTVRRPGKASKMPPRGRSARVAPADRTRPARFGFAIHRARNAKFAGRRSLPWRCRVRREQRMRENKNGDGRSCNKPGKKGLCRTRKKSPHQGKNQASGSARKRFEQQPYKSLERRLNAVCVLPLMRA